MLFQVNDLLARSPLSMTLIIRLIPVGNNLLTNLLGGVSVVPATWFLLGTLLGHLPQNVVFALLGSGIHVAPVWRTTLSVLLFLASSLLGYLLYRRHRLEKVLPEDNGENGSDGA